MKKNKRQTSNKSQFCSICLSEDRNLVCSLELWDIFLKYFKNLNMLRNELEMCWECCNVLRKIEQFEKKAKLAQEVLKLHSLGSLSTPIKSLSTLTTVIIDMNLNTEVKEEIDEKPFIYKENNEIEMEIKSEEDLNIIIRKGTEKDDFVKNTDYKAEDVNINDKDAKAKEEIGLNVDIKMNDLEQDFSEDEIYEDNKIEDFKDDISEKIDHILKARRKRKKKYSKKKYNTASQQYLYLKKPNDYIDTIDLDKDEIDNILAIERQRAEYMDKDFKCPFPNCVFAFDIEAHLGQHNKFHQDRRSKKLCCDICLMKYSKTSLFDGHVKNHFKMYRCTICDFTSYAILGIMKIFLHVKDHTDLIKCLDCDKIFKNKLIFKEHKKKYHSEYICDMCGAPRQSKKKLIKHIKEHHNDYTCKECNIKFKFKRGYDYHCLEKHVVEPSENSFCISCDKQFDNVHLYRRHVLSSVAHRRENNLKSRREVNVVCPECNKTYARRQYMLNHYRLVHLNTSKYTCEYCGKKCLNATSFKRHKSKHDGIPMKKDKQCIYCEKKFSTKVILENHIRTHTGERPFACELCSASFSQKAALKTHVKHTRRILDNHMRTHTGERPFQCELCPSAFAQKQSLKMHTKKLHCKD